MSHGVKRYFRPTPRLLNYLLDMRQSADYICHRMILNMIDSAPLDRILHCSNIEAYY